MLWPVDSICLTGACAIVVSEHYVANFNLISNQVWLSLHN